MIQAMAHARLIWLCLCLVCSIDGCSSRSAAKVDASPEAGTADAPSVADLAVAGTGGGAGSGGAGGMLGGAGGAGGDVGEDAAAGAAGGSTGLGGLGGGVGGGGRTSGSGGDGGATHPTDAASGGVPGSGGRTVASGGTGGSTDSDAGSPSDGDRRDRSVPACGKLEATLGGSATEESSLQRLATSGSDCRKYVVQNNNFADPTGSTQTLRCTGTSFEVVSSTAASASDARGPAAFPSVYIGGNGDIANGTYLTWEDSYLPIRVSNIAKIQTRLDWSGGAPDGDFAASYAAWFAKSQPPAGSYDDALSGTLMIWLGQPAKRQPVGTRVREATVAGRRWDVWVGKHGGTALESDGPNRPIVSYVVQDGPLASLAFDLVTFIHDAVANAGQDQSAGGTSQAFSSSWYLTDVIAGFQIWTGSDAAGLKCTRFDCEVK